ncbi:MAG TPA: hypothetical protein VIL85_21815 [Thermomicrobiales bacterium]
MATGRGAAFFPAAEAVDPTGSVIGLDLSEGMVWATREEAARRHRRGARGGRRGAGLLRRDVRRRPLRLRLMFFPQVPRALAEFRRIRRPGGQPGVSTWQITQADDLGAVLAQQGLLDVNQEVLRFSVADEPAGALTAAEFAAVRVPANTVDFC